MEIHKPKPWHGWREFFKEYLIIVVGVLTALGAEQAVEWLHWRHEVHVAREAIAFDLGEIVARTASKDGESACVGERLGEIAEALDSAQTTKRLPPMGRLANPDTPPGGLRSWSGLTSGQALAHFPNRDQLLLSGIESYLAKLGSNTREEQQEWAVLSSMVGPGRATSDAEIASLRAALGRARWDAIYHKVGSRQVASLVVRTGFLSPKQIQDAYRVGLDKAKTLRACQPLQPAPSRSADSFHDVLDRPPIPPDVKASGVLALGNAGALTTER
jgi:hypothetical protein